jgi:ornithine decarboxylase
MITNRVRAFLASQRPDSLCLVLDRGVVREKYLSYARALPHTKVYYAVKANPDPAILELLVELGSAFDAAAIAKIRAVIAAGGTPENISYGNTTRDALVGLSARRYG